MKLHHMRREPKKDDESDSVMMDGDKYPHGLALHLGHEELQKLGIKDTPKPGSTYRIEAHARVTDAHHPADGKKEGRRVGMHITHMGAEEKAGKGLREDIETAHDNQGNKITKGKESKVETAKGKDAGARPENATVLPKGRN